MTKVKNINGTSKNTCKCASWLTHWEKGTNKKADECAACRNKATLGGHVIMVGSSDQNWYIIPLCNSCNGSSDEFTAYEPLVSANVSKTCG